MLSASDFISILTQVGGVGGRGMGEWEKRREGERGQIGRFRRRDRLRGRSMDGKTRTSHACTLYSASSMEVKESISLIAHLSSGSRHYAPP